MHKFVLSTFSVAAFAAAIAAQSSPGVMTPLAPNNGVNLGATVISTTETAGEIVQALEQIELYPLGSGAYRVVATAQIVGQPDFKLISGTLILASNPPLWLPANDLANLNTAGAAGDEFAGSLSSDGLIVVWDNYVGATYPNVPVAATTFICKRVSTTNQFSVNDVRAITGVAPGGVDPTIGEELANGNIVLYHLTGTTAVDTINKLEVDPLTGIGNPLSPNSGIAATPSAGGNAPNQTPGNIGFNHSPSVQRDGAGKARALTYSVYLTGGLAGAGSDGIWQSNVNNAAGNVWTIAKRDVNLTNDIWFANPAVVGGTWAWATSGTGGYGDPSVFEGNALADTSFLGGSGRIAAYAPVQDGVMVSVVVIGSPAPPYQVPPVLGDIMIFPTVGALDIRFHSVETGLAEWIFNAVPFLGAQFPMQLLTLRNDGVSPVTIHAGNVATLSM